MKAENLDFPTKDFVAGTTTVICEFVKFDKQLHRVGTIAVNDMGENVEQYVAQEKENRSDKNQKAIHKAFLKAADNKYVMFFKDKAATEEFLTEKMGYHFAQGVKLPEFKTDRNIMLMASPKTGLTVQPGFLSCLNAEHNPYFNQEDAAKNTLPVIARANAIPYDIICHMLDDGMLSEATFSGSDNAEENKKLAQDNLPFIVDYYYHNNRTK